MGLLAVVDEKWLGTSDRSQWAVSSEEKSGN
jgi:hypothetical protein